MSHTQADATRHHFSSDHHVGHDNILRHCAQTRPFRYVQAMNEAYVDCWNAAVAPRDTVWYLGDMSLKFPVAASHLARLNGTKHLVVGNHDKCFKMHEQQVAQYLAAGFASVQRHHVLELRGRRFALCHFPYRVPPHARSPDPAIARRQERYAELSLVPGANGEVALVHGHVHQYWRARVQCAPLPEINVAVDAWGGAPVSEDALLALCKDACTRQTPSLLSWYGAWGAPEPTHPETSRTGG